MQASMNANIPVHFWNYAVRVAAYTRNMYFDPRIGKTLFEALASEKPNIENMHIFGTYFFTSTEKKLKLDKQCDERIFLGNDTCSPAYLQYILQRDQLRRVRLVKFTDHSNR